MNGDTNESRPGYRLASFTTGYVPGTTLRLLPSLSAMGIGDALDPGFRYRCLWPSIPIGIVDDSCAHGGPSSDLWRAIGGCMARHRKWYQRPCAAARRDAGTAPIRHLTEGIRVVASALLTASAIAIRRTNDRALSPRPGASACPLRAQPHCRPGLSRSCFC